MGPLTTAGTLQSFSYALTGVDTDCASGGNTSIKNSCGIHIHVGTSCAGNTGAHYYTGAVTTDPWLYVSYTSTGSGTTAGRVVVDTGAMQGEAHDFGMASLNHVPRSTKASHSSGLSPASPGGRLLRGGGRSARFLFPVEA